MRLQEELPLPTKTFHTVVSGFSDRDMVTSFANLVRDEIQSVSQRKYNGQEERRNPDFVGFGYIISSNSQGYMDPDEPLRFKVDFSIPYTLEVERVGTHIESMAHAFSRDHNLDGLHVIRPVVPPIVPLEISQPLALGLERPNTTNL